MRKSVIVIGLYGIVAAVAVVAAPPQAAQAEASFAPSSLALRTPVSGWANARLVVAGPEGFRVERTFLPGEPLAVDFSRLKDAKGERVEVPDGRYKWELTLTAPISNATPRPDANDASVQAWVSSGSFRVENGSLVAPVEERKGVPVATVSEQSASPIGPVTAMTTNPDGNHFSNNLTSAGGVCSGCTDGDTDLVWGELLVKWDWPRISIRDTNDDQLWQWWSNAGDLKLSSARLDTSNLRDSLTIEKDSPNNTLYLDNSGRIGINTSTPIWDLHVKDGSSSGVLGIEAATGEKGVFFVGTAFEGLGLYSATYGYLEPLKIYHGAPDGAISIKNGGDIVLGGNFTNYAPLTVGYNTATTNALVAPMIVTTYSTGTVANGFGAMTQWGLEAADGTLAVAADFGALWENASSKNAALIFRAATSGSAVERMRISGSTGYIGFQVSNPLYPIHHANGARLTTGGVWTDASSRAFKQDIEELDAAAAIATVKDLTPVTYAYKADPSEHHVGFIAEDVPEMVAAKDRTGLAPMDVVAVLTKVVQEQQKTIESQGQSLSAQQQTIEAQQAQIAELRGMVERLAANH